MLKALKYLWASPVILVGLLCALPFLGEDIEWRDGALVVRAYNRLGKWMAWQGWGGVTIGVTVFLWATHHHVIEYHERVHVRQVLKWGPLFPLVYFGSLALHGYRGNVFEAEAYEETSNWLKHEHNH